MEKIFLKKTVLIMLCAAMVMALFACDSGDAETNAITNDGTENPTVSEFGTEPEETDPDCTDPVESNPTESDSAESDSAESDSAESDPAQTGPEDEKTDIAAEVDYYLAFDNKTTGKTHYFEGKSDGIYHLSSDSEDGAVRVRLEAAAGGYYLYFIKNAVKSYVNVTKTASFISLAFDNEAKTVYTYDEALATLITSIEGKNYFLGAYGDFTYFSLSEISYANDSYVSYLVAAECEHSYVGSDEGHSLLACAKCGLAAGALQPHGESVSTMEKGKKTTYCKECGYILKIEFCDGFHWLSDAEGHWEGACDICGTLESAEKRAHSDVLAEFVTDTTYSMGCEICAYAHYSKDISFVEYLITARQWGIKATTYYQLNSGRSYGWFYYDEGDVPYGRITGSDKVGQILYNRNYNDASGASEAQQYTMDVGNSKYLIIKIRTNDNTQHMSLAFSTTGKNGVKSLTIPTSMLTNDEWGVIAIDLANTFGDYYAKDAESGKYLVDSFYISMNEFESTTNIDIAYMAFFDGKINQASVFVDEKEAILVSGTNISKHEFVIESCSGNHPFEAVGNSGHYIPACYICGTSATKVEPHDYKEIGGKNVCSICQYEHVHEFTVTVSEGYYVGICSSCGDQKDYGVKADAVNKFYGAEFFSANSYALNGKLDKELIYDETGAFVRYDNAQINADKWIGFNPITKTSGASGQYMVLKVRIGENGLGQTILQIYVNSTGSEANRVGWTQGNLQFKVSEDGQWHYIVVDLAALVPNNAFAQDSDGTYNVNFFQVRPFTGHQSVDVQDGQDTDSSKVYTYHYYQKDENGELIKDKGNPVTKLKTQTKLTAEELEEGKYVLANITTSKPDASDYMDIAYIAFCDELDDVSSIVSDDVYEWSKSRTESELRKTADHSCAAHSPSSVQTSTVANGTKYSAVCTVCSQVCYEITVPASVSKFYTGKDFATSATTYFNAGKGSVEYDPDNNIVFGRESGNLQLIWHRAQNDLKYDTRSNQTTTIDVGNARFFVIRVRTSNTARTLKLNYSTTAKNSDTAVATEDLGEKTYDITGKTGVKAGDTYCTNAGYITFTFPMASVTVGEWTTFVIDLNAVAGEYHGKVSGAESYVVDTFYFDENDQTGNLDVEYMAFVEGDWSDVADLVGAGEVINITNKSGTFEKKTLS